MAAARPDHRPVGRPATRSQPLYSVTGVDARVRQELTSQYESAVAFADFCTFLTSGRLSDQAGQLVSLAQELFSETNEDLQGSRPRG